MPPFPFSAIVGQDTLKRALLLCVLQPALGGVLIRGTKGVAKSTAVRALAALLPPIETVAGCPFQRRPGEEIPDWPLPDNAPVVARPVPLVELPLGATEDRVLGSLHLEKALRGERAFEPGLLAAANRGLLYIDEVNLLPDHLVDVLLDAAAGGVHQVEREGLSLTHPARFVLVGTMNPEEGELRPQLLDRFGLAVDVSDLSDTVDRAEAVKRRLAYEGDPERFVALWEAAEAGERARIIHALRILPEVRIPDALLRAVSERCVAAGVEGLRADLRLCQAACAQAAYEGRTAVEPQDIEAVAELALAHRRTKPIEPPPTGSERETRRSWHAARDKGTEMNPGNTSSPSQPAALPSPTSVFASAGLFVPRAQPAPATLAPSQVEGRWRTGAGRRRGFSPARFPLPEKTAQELAWMATLRAAAPQQSQRGRVEGGRIILRNGDVRVRSRQGPTGCLLLFVIDTSGSMAAWKRMRETKAAVLSLLVRAYQGRDQVAFLAFREDRCELVMPPSRALPSARQALESLPVGGTTPLAHGLAAACRVVRKQRQRRPRLSIWTVLLTDGRTNVALAPAGDPWRDVMAQGRELAALPTQCLVVDTETGWPRLGRAAAVAQALRATCLPLPELLGRPLPDRWRQAV